MLFRKEEHNLRRKSSWFWLSTCVATALFVLVSSKATTGYQDIANVRSQAAFTEEVQFDNYSLILKGQRIFIHSGEFHTFRLPVPSLWPDILQKVKASGMNAISVYTHMGLINPSPGVVDFDGFRALQPLYDAAKDAGIWIYINAETTAGGIAHWATSQVAGALRTNATDWQAAWQPYIEGIINVTAPNQITAGGPVIDNEYSQNPISHAEYFVEIEDLYRGSDSGIDVPLTYNDPGENENFINGTGAVDLYGLDSYPQGFDCSNPTSWNPVTTNYHSYHENVNPSQPFYFPEFQGGSFDAWGPNAPGPDFQSVFNLQLWASNAKLISYYMFYGGTSWGAIPFHGVYTSYDYGASLEESRQLTDKYDEIKRQALFLRSSPEFYKTDWIADSSSGLAVSTSSAAFVTLLQNPDTNARFYIVRQTESTSTANITFKLNVTTNATPNSIQIPVVASSIALSGRQSKVIVTNYAFGDSSSALYSTAQVFFAGVIDGRDVLFLHGNSSQEHEVALALTGTPKQFQNSTQVEFSVGAPGIASGTTVVSFLAGIEGLITVWDSDTQLILYADSATAATFWAPTIATNSDDPFKNYWSIGTNTSILVGGPYLVRNASIDGTTLALRERSVNLSINGGEAFAASVWLNNVFLNTSFGNSSNNQNILEETDDKFTFPEGALLPGEDNVITIVQDNMGLNETDGSNTDASKSPRGVRGFQLNSGNFTTWRVQGKVGGYVNYPDKVRGIFNEGGLFGERKGWHLPGFDTSAWPSRELIDGLPGSEAGVGFFVTTFNLAIPKGFDVPMSFTFQEPLGQPYRAFFFVNGWMMGKRVGNLGPQSKFPVHEGILDYNGVK
ncbi:hypothetical protein H0H92_011481 [Tricholoma furcatifolium]|nr:hypothetical protein H0H92_011481 [Tricholoma furcatifolium]